MASCFPDAIHRLATAADFEAVYSIYMEEDVIRYLAFDPMSRAEFLPVMTELVASQAFYLVECDGRIEGFYRASRHAGRASHVASLQTLALRKEARGSGLAQSMIERAVSRLHSEGARRVELMVESDNPRALQFYRKLGFEVEGVMRSAYKRAGEAEYIDEVLMARLLPPLDARGSQPAAVPSK